MVLRLIAHIIAGILLAGFMVYVIALVTDAAWKSLQRRSATRRAAEQLLTSWSQLADAQRQAIEPSNWKQVKRPTSNRHDAHLHLIRPDDE